MRRFFKSFSIRLSLRFMFIMTGSAVLLSLSFLVLTRSLILNEQRREFKKAEGAVYKKLEEMSRNPSVVPNNGGTLGQIPELPYYFSYVIYDVNTRVLLATNDPFLPFLEDSRGKLRRYFDKDYFFDGDLNVIYYAERHTNELRNEIIIAVAMNMDTNSIGAIFRTLPLAMLFLVIPVLCLSFLLAFFLTKNTIRPVARITKAAQSVTLENISDFLPLTGYDDEIDELSKTFNSLFLRLKQDFDRERQFSSDVSHELNTPLTVISGQTSLLLRWGKDNPEQLDKSLNAIKAEAKTMQAIIANLLQISRIESGRIKPQISEVSVDSLFSWLTEEFGAIAPEARIVSSAGGVSLRTDSEMLHQILTVLISNSVKFADGDCEVRLSATRREGSVIIEQSDNGPGFSEKSLPHIFERFYRADESHTRKIAGSGLGLAIAETLCNALGAKIKARNMTPHGAGFVIEFSDRTAV